MTLLPLLWQPLISTAPALDSVAVWVSVTARGDVTRRSIGGQHVDALGRFAALTYVTKTGHLTVVWLECPNLNH
jgi:hypothetical protein